MQKATASSSRSDSNSGKPKLEREIQHDILLAFGALPFLRIWRTNTGKAYGYSLVRAVLDHFKRRRFELGYNLLKNMPLTTYGTPGAADIQGLLEYVYVDSRRLKSMKLGRFLAIECKKPGQVQDEDQVKWQAMVERHGGLYILAYSVADVWDALKAEGFEDPDFEVTE